MEESVEPLAHVDSLSKLSPSLVGCEWVLEHSNGAHVDDGPPLPGRQDVGPHSRCKVVVSHEYHVHSSEGKREEGRRLKHSLRVVHPVDDGLVLLPLVVIHAHFY